MLVGESRITEGPDGCPRGGHSCVPGRGGGVQGGTLSGASLRGRSVLLQIDRNRTHLN